MNTIISQLTCSKDTLVVAESSLETVLSPLQNCSEGGLVEAELNYDVTTTSHEVAIDCAMAFIYHIECFLGVLSTKAPSVDVQQLSFLER